MIRQTLVPALALGLVSSLGLGPALLASESRCNGAGSNAACNPPDPVVVTDRGPVRGTVVDGLREFLGVPYAAPPVGALRWRPPVEHPRWSRPFDATHYGSTCPQDESFWGIASRNEDCLFLNVFAPDDTRSARQDERSRRHPVMVWIHGGLLSLGEGDDYGPARLVEQGDVVVVTLNYRLGAFGFLAHPALTAESGTGTSGNYGLLDQQFALGWVQRNIAAFGGDPANVTLFGESAGGASVFCHLASPPAAGTFHRAIVESGAYALTLPALADEEALGLDFAAAAGCEEGGADCLRALPVEAVIAHQDLISTLPVVDGRALPESPGEALAKGDFSHVPVMQGTNHDEMRFFVALDELEGQPVTDANYADVVAGYVGADAAPDVIAHYPPERYGSPALAWAAIQTDTVLACPARAVDQLLSNAVPTYSYEFDDSTAPEVFLPPVSFSYGAAHASELQYVFDLRLSVPLTDAQRGLSDTMIRYWTQFARTGSPNPPDAPRWPRYTSANDQFQPLAPPWLVPVSAFAVDHQCDYWGFPPAAPGSK